MLLVADALKALVTLLASATGVPFSSETPTNVPSRYGRVQHLIGTRDSLVLDTQNFHVRVWGLSPHDAWDLARHAHGAVCGSEGTTVAGVLINAAEADLPAWFPDPDTGGASYIFTATLTTEAVDATT